MNAIELAVASMKMYQQTNPDDACIAVFGREKLVSVLPGEKMDLHVDAGTPVEALKGTVSYQVLQTGQTTREERGPEHFGIGYIATASPLFENDEVVGVLTALVSNERLEKLRSGGTELAAIVEKVNATRASSHIAEMTQNAASHAEHMDEVVGKINTMAQFVEEVASQSNLLGLNATYKSSGTFGGSPYVGYSSRCVSQNPNGYAPSFVIR